jgi:hypothetical protein
LQTVSPRPGCIDLLQPKQVLTGPVLVAFFIVGIELARHPGPLAWLLQARWNEGDGFPAVLI